MQVRRPPVRFQIGAILSGTGEGDQPLHLRGAGHEHKPVTNVSGSDAVWAQNEAN